MRDRIWCTQVNRVAKVPLPPRARFTHKHNASLSPGKRGGGERGQGVCVHKRERCEGRAAGCVCGQGKETCTIASATAWKSPLLTTQSKVLSSRLRTVAPSICNASDTCDAAGPGDRTWAGKRWDKSSKHCDAVSHVCSSCLCCAHRASCV